MMMPTHLIQDDLPSLNRVIQAVKMNSSALGPGLEVGFVYRLKVSVRSTSYLFLLSSFGQRSLYPHPPLILIEPSLINADSRICFKNDEVLNSDGEWETVEMRRICRFGWEAVAI